MAVFHPRARFDSYVEDVLPPASHERMAAHLEQCDECRREVAQRQRILQAASSLSASSSSAYSSSSALPSRAVPPPYAPSGHARAAADEPRTGMRPVLESREGVAGWKVVAGLGALGLAAVAVLSTAWIAGDPAATASRETGENLLLPVSSVGSSPVDPGAGTVASASPTAGGPGNDASDGTDPGTASADEATTGPVVLSPAGLTGSTAVPSLPSPQDSGGGTGGKVSAGVALAGAMALTPDMVTDLRELGWNVPSLNGLGLSRQSAGWNLGEGTAEVVMTLWDDDVSLVLHECRSLAEDGGTPGCPLGDGLTGTGTQAGAVAESGDTRELPVGVEMSILEHRDGTWTATAQTAEAAYTVDSDLPVSRADRVMSLVVISERSRVRSGTAPERPADRLARGFERLLPWMDGVVEDRR